MEQTTATMPRRSPQTSLPLALALLVISAATPRATMAGQIPLYSWYSVERQDSFTTSDPAWACSTPGTMRSGYRFVRVEGSVFDPGQPQPPDTRALYHWWSPSRSDNFLTTSAFAAVAPDYAKFRLEGYVYATPVAGTLPLTSWWSAGKVDNKMSADPRLASAAPNTIAEYGDYQFVKTEGYILPPALTFDPQPPYDKAAFGFGIRAYNGQPLRGTRPLLVFLAEFNGMYFASDRTAAYYDGLMFGPEGAGSGQWTIPGYFTEVSNRQFTYTRAGVLGPVNMVHFPTNQAETTALSTRVLQTAAAMGFDFSAYDVAPHDGVVGFEELGVIIINAQPGNCASLQPATPVSVTSPTGGSLTLWPAMTQVNRGVGFATLVHELAHQLGEALDLYAEDFNSMKSLMGATCAPNDAEDVHQTVHLDPWHKIQFGWLMPRAMPFNQRGTFPGASLELLAAGEATGRTSDPFAYILVDPARGPDEYFIVEYRMRRWYDASVAVGTDTEGGLAVWHVTTDSNKRPRLFEKILPGDDGILQTRPSGDDYETDWPRADGNPSPRVIMPGPNWIRSTGMYPTDALAANHALYFVGPAATLGTGPLWRAFHPVATGLRWFDRVSTGLRVRVQDGSKTRPVDWTSMVVDWNMDQTNPAPRARLDSAPSHVRRGDTITLQGAFGAVQGSKSVKLGNYTLAPLSWSSFEVVVRIPTGIDPAQYQLRVESDLAARSNALVVNVSY